MSNSKTTERNARRPNPLEAAHLKFCGLVCRTISHEMNNVTAILMELVGLMEDRLAASADRGSDAGRTASTLERMTRQLERAKGLGMLLNSFGHSVDEFAGEVKVGQAGGEAVALCRRFADMNRCSLEYAAGESDTLAFEGSRFAILHMLFRMIQIALRSAKPGDRILLRAREENGGCLFELDGATLSDCGERGMLEALLAAAGGRLLHDRPGIWIPWRPDFPGQAANDGRAGGEVSDGR